VRIRSFVSVAATLAAATALQAQNSPQMSPAAAIPEWRSFVGANPLGIPFDIVSVEAETVIATGTTVGGLASYNDFDSKQFTTFDAKFKYYPGEVAMRGFSIGLSLGHTVFKGENTDVAPDPVTNEYPRATFKAGTLGVLVDYNWTLGPAQRFIVGTGVGAKRILASREKREVLGMDRAYPTARFVIGLLF
jgi:hypothetical protein